MKVRTLEGPFSKNKENEVVNLNFDIDSLEITVSIDGHNLDVTFDSLAGFRVLDEGDLLEFWPTCSTTNGWLFEIMDQGWLSQEGKRNGFSSIHNSEVKEYFITGINYCVNVLAWEDPVVTERMC